MAGLQVGQALGCSGCLGLGSAVPGPPPPIFLGTQPPYVTKVLTTHLRMLSSYERKQLFLKPKKKKPVKNKIYYVIIHIQHE